MQTESIVTERAARLRAVMEEVRNGTENYHGHWANRRFVYTDGALEFAEEAGSHWLLDIVATECAPIACKHAGEFGTYLLAVKADGKGAQLELVDSDGNQRWSRTLDFADLPAGEWIFTLGYLDPDGQVAVLALPSED